jgi:hypothetical protein
MALTVRNITDLKKLRGADTIKKKLVIDKDGVPAYCAIYYEGLKTPFVYDYELDDTISQYNWCLGQNGYAVSRTHLMHQVVWGDSYDAPMSIDHMNQVKTDNRRCNLRLTNQSNQNSNRATRSDRLPPPDELIEMGVNEMPRHIRWCKPEGRFIIEKHPALLKRVEMGLIKKPSMNCTRLSSLTVVQRYQDALARYVELSKESSNEDLEFAALKDKLVLEYSSIIEVLNAFLNVELTTPTLQVLVTAHLDPQRGPAQNKHTITVLPPEYMMEHGDIPRYCHYKKAEEKRKDGFLIEKHPGFKYIEGKEDLKKGGSWNIRRDIPPLEKRRIFLQKYVELQKAAGLPMDKKNYTENFWNILENETLV